MKLRTTVKKVGNSKGIYIKNDLLNRIGLAVGDQITILCNGKVIRVKKKS